MAATVATGQGQDPAQAAAQAASAPAVKTNTRVSRLRSWMLALVASSVAFGVLAGLIVWQANVAAYDAYHTIVDEGSVSVDAALRARSAALDHMTAAATYLETKGDIQQQARARADQN